MSDRNVNQSGAGRADPSRIGEHAAARNDPPTALLEVLEGAARLQSLVPDAVLVGGSAAAMYAGHRVSFDHDHVVADLRDRFDLVLEALESEGEWVTNRVSPGKVILGELGDIEAGVRQLIRRRPLEVQRISLPSGAQLTVPTIAETLRIKAFLAVKRNRVRDYLDIAALANTMGVSDAAAVLSKIDEFYADQHGAGDGVARQVVAQLSDPRPKDSKVIAQLSRYKNLEPRWQSWPNVVAQCQAIADAMVLQEGDDGDDGLP